MGQQVPEIPDPRRPVRLQTARGAIGVARPRRAALAAEIDAGPPSVHFNPLLSQPQTQLPAEPVQHRNSIRSNGIGLRGVNQMLLSIIQNGQDQKAARLPVIRPAPHFSTAVYTKKGQAKLVCGKYYRVWNEMVLFF